MDKVKFLALSIGIAVALVSCDNSSSFEAELKTIDSLQTVVNNYKAELEALDMDEIASRGKISGEQYEYLEKNYRDSSKREFWLNKMTFYRSVKKSYAHAAEMRPKLMTEIELCSKQLETLENSIVDNKLNKEQVDEYLADEAMAVQELSLHMSKVPDFEEVDKMYEDLKPTMDSVQQTLKAEK